MSKLHELLAAEKTVSAAWNTLYEETLKKFGNDHFFSGHTKSLKMLEDSAQNEALEAQAQDHKEVATNVHDTLEYALDLYAKAEDLQYQKNTTNAVACADVMLRGEKLFSNLPVDQLLGLESRLGKIRLLYLAVPTLDASKAWSFDGRTGGWISMPEFGTKTEKIMVPVILAEATDKHPAQVKESTRDNIVGKFTTVKRSGAATAVQKAEAIKLVDELLVEVKKARLRANDTTTTTEKLGSDLVDVLLAPFKN
jgi:hypothetical protein